MDLIHEKNEEYIVRETTIVERKKKWNWAYIPSKIITCPIYET